MADKLISDEQLFFAAEQIADKLLSINKSVCTAESCTGGWLAKLFTDLAGSSIWFEGGVVSYSNMLKHELLGVPLTLIEQNGAVSNVVATAMAEGALKVMQCDYSVAITGVAGPAGGSERSPIGTVFISVAGKRRENQMHCDTRQYNFSGGRDQVRRQTLCQAMKQLETMVVIPKQG